MWPIRNPLYLPNAHQATYTSSESTETSSRATKARDAAQDVHMRSPLSHVPMPVFSRSHHHEPLRRPNSHPPPLSHFPKPPHETRGNGRIDIWDDSFSSFRDSRDDISLESCPTQRSTSNSTGDMFLGNNRFTSSHHFKPHRPWANPSSNYQHNAESGRDDQRPRKENDRRMVLTLRDDQLGQIIEAISPAKSHRDLPLGSGIQHNVYSGRPPTTHVYYPPKLGSLPVTVRPSTAALARKSSYPNLTAGLRTVPNRPSPDKSNATDNHKSKSTMTYQPSASSNQENFPPSQSRLPTPFPYANHVPTPNPFVPRLPHWDPNASTGVESSVFSSFKRYNGSEALASLGAHGKHGAAHTPSIVSGIKSRKEGLARNSPNLSEHEVQHDLSVCPPLSVGHNTTQRPTTRDHTNASNITPRMLPRSTPATVEIIDVDAIDPTLSNDPPLDAAKLSPFMLNHKCGMSSIDSTGRLERQLFSALGEELGSLDSHVDTTGMGRELTRALHRTTAPSDLSGSASLNPAASEFEPVGKRKRRGTLVGERDRSPVSKREKGGEADVEEFEEQNMPQLRGD